MYGIEKVMFPKWPYCLVGNHSIIKIHDSFMFSSKNWVRLGIKSMNLNQIRTYSSWLLNVFLSNTSYDKHYHAYNRPDKEILCFLQKWIMNIVHCLCFLFRQHKTLLSLCFTIKHPHNSYRDKLFHKQSLWLKILDRAYFLDKLRIYTIN